MPATGRPPKDPRKRARTNTDPMPVRYVPNRAIMQPALQGILGLTNPATGQPWTEATLELWESLESFPTTESLQQAQWQVLARAMILDDRAMRGDMKALPELRAALSKFGIAPDDVARLRIFFADADEKEDKGAARKARQAASEGEPTGSRARYGGLRAVSND